MNSRAVPNALISAIPPRAIAAAVRAVYPRIEPELSRLGEFMPRGGVALDVGVWLGPWYTRMTRFADRVVAIEAHPKLVALLRASIPGVEVVHAAASDAPGEIDLLVPAAGPFIGVSSVEHGEGGGTPVTVPRITIDGLGLRDVRFIKMDVEGHELAALRGAAETINRDRPAVLVELEARLQDVNPVIDLFESWGYRGSVLPGRDWIPLAEFDLVTHQRGAIQRVTQSFARRLAWPKPRYVNMVLFRSTR